MRADYRDTFMALLQKRYDADELKLTGDQRHLAFPERFAQWREELESIEWITYAGSLSDDNEVFSPEAMERTVGYLARYASRVAISNDRLISLENGHVSFYYKDYRDNRGQGPMKVKELPIVDFIHRFLQHVMPNSMRSSRNCGYMSNGLRRDSLAAIRAQLEAREAPQDQLPNDEPESDDEFDEVEDDRNKCPKCGHNQWTITERMRRPNRMSFADRARHS